jgi:uncharacterized protein YcbX
VSARVSWIQLTPVKGLAIGQVDEVDVLEHGLRGDRRFFLVDERNRIVNSKGRRSPLQLVHASYDEEPKVLSMRLADGTEVSGEANEGAEVVAVFPRRELPARRVEGPWDAALSQVLGMPVRLVVPPHGAADRGRSGGATLLAETSLAAIAGVLGVEQVDRRRFRMNFGIEGLDAHEEDSWIGRRVKVGDAVVIPQGNVGRCAITTQNPETGKADLDTLKALADYRREVETTEPLPFGVYAAVAEPGRVRVGDPITLM